VVVVVVAPVPLPLLVVVVVVLGRQCATAVCPDRGDGGVPAVFGLIQRRQEAGVEVEVEEEDEGNKSSSQQSL
jgi:hypothetical protein